MCLAVPGKIVSIEAGGAAAGALGREGCVSFAGQRRQVNLALVPEAAVGDYVIVHSGFAISRVDRGAAEQSLRDFELLRASQSAGQGDDGVDVA